MANQSIVQLENDFNKLNNLNNKEKNNLCNLQNDFEKERTIRMEAEKNNQKLQGIVREKEDNLHKLNLMNDSLKMNMDQANNINNKYL